MEKKEMIDKLKETIKFIESNKAGSFDKKEILDNIDELHDVINMLSVINVS